MDETLSLHSVCLPKRVFEVELKMSSFLHQRNVPTGKIRYSNGGDSRRNDEGKERNQPVFPKCAINIAQPEDVVVGTEASLFVHIRESIGVTSISWQDGLALALYQFESSTAALVWPSSLIHNTFHSLRTSGQTFPSF